MTHAGRDEAMLVVFYGGSPQERREADGLARAAGWRVRLASRPAELAKATADGFARVCVLDAQLTVPAAHVTRTPGETVSHFVSRALAGA
ncbi:MAG: hypothetical protein K2Y26_04770 [Gemmatimonadaceae bacterium]|nr:hypothetical protein [Gemmatimonadaceae bacterium]